MKIIISKPRIEPRFIDSNEACAYEGEVVWSWQKSLWMTSIYLIAIIGGALTFSLQNFLFFLIVTAIVLCFGHSLGMHRRLIHRSFACPQWVEYMMVYLGSIVGLGGPITMIHTHDLRDWAQRKPKCHDYFAHRQSLLRDAVWQIHCDIKLKNMPEFALEPDIKHDKFYQFIENTTYLQQIMWAVLFYLVGGIGLAIWGVACRIAVSVTGHWLIGYFAHNDGHQDWIVQDAGVQGYNIQFCGLITFGECWHNNHHAFPGSAKLGLEKNQTDPGWWVLQALNKVGLVWNIHVPADLPPRDNLIKLTT